MPRTPPGISPDSTREIGICSPARMKAVLRCPRSCARSVTAPSTTASTGTCSSSNWSAAISSSISVLAAMSTLETITSRRSPPLIASCFTPCEYRNTPAVAIVARMSARTTTTPRDFIFDPPLSPSPSLSEARSFVLGRWSLHPSLRSFTTETFSPRGCRFVLGERLGDQPNRSGSPVLRSGAGDAAARTRGPDRSRRARCPARACSPRSPAAGSSPTMYAVSIWQSLP